jgi:hypothetical protein
MNRSPIIALAMLLGACAGGASDTVPETPSARSDTSQEQVRAVAHKLHHFGNDLGGGGYGTDRYLWLGHSKDGKEVCRVTTFANSSRLRVEVEARLENQAPVKFQLLDNLYAPQRLLVRTPGSALHAETEVFKDKVQVAQIIDADFDDKDPTMKTLTVTEGDKKVECKDVVRVLELSDSDEGGMANKARDKYMKQILRDFQIDPPKPHLDYKLTPDRKSLECTFAVTAYKFDGAPKQPGILSAKFPLTGTHVIQFPEEVKLTVEGRPAR